MDIEVTITMEKVSLRYGGNDYSDTPDFTSERLNALSILRAEGEPDQYGRELFQAVFGEQSQRGYRQALDTARERNEQCHLRLNIDQGALTLHALWWETLLDQVPPPIRLGCSTMISLSRYLSLGGGARAPVRAEKLKLLVAISNPKDLGVGKWQHVAPIEVEKELDAISEALGDMHDRIDWEFLKGPASVVNIRETLRDGDFHILHIVAHGLFLESEQEGGLLLEDENDRSARPVRETSFGNMVSELLKLELVVVAACFSARQSTFDPLKGLGPRMLVHGVPAVITMQDQVSSTTAQLFTKKFYESLVRSKVGLVDVAMNTARESILLNDGEGWDWAIPVLFMRGEGRLFERTTNRKKADRGLYSSRQGTSSQPGQRLRRSSGSKPKSPTLGESLDEASATTRAKVDADAGARRAKVLDLLVESGFDEQELRMVCSTTGIEYGQLSGRTPVAKVGDLLLTCEREGLLDALTMRIRAQQKARGLNLLGQNSHT